MASTSCSSPLLSSSKSETHVLQRGLTCAGSSPRWVVEERPTTVVFRPDQGRASTHTIEVARDPKHS